MNIRIGITDTASRYENYPAWVKGQRTDVEIVRLSAAQNNAHEVETCHAVVFTGGVDVHPRFYGKTDENYPKAPYTFDTLRDEFELDVFKRAQSKGLPVLGICRGLQLINVALGGTLVIDLETAGKEDHTRHGLTDGVHNITLLKNSLLFACSRELSGTVNSAHHQAIGKIAPGLKITAYSPDLVPEAAEYADKEGKPWMLLVQWHPERLHQNDPGNPLEIEIRKAFFEAIDTQLRIPDTYRDE